MLRTRHPASDAVLDLREALEKTQPQLAELIGASRTTVARWETSHPPTGETLVTLARVADQHGLKSLSDTFMELYILHVDATIGDFFSARWIRRKDGQTGVIFARLKNDEQNRAAQQLVLLCARKEIHPRKEILDANPL